MELMFIIMLGIVFFLIATVVSMFGKGGGDFYVPLMVTFGMGFQESASISLFVLMSCGIMMTAVYRKKNMIDWKLSTIVIISSATGSFIGGYISADFNPAILKLIFSFLLVVSASLLYKMPDLSGKFDKGIIWHRKCCSYEYDVPILVIVPLAFIIGLLAGMVGIAGGSIIVPMMIILAAVPMRIAFATNSIIVLFTSTTAFAGHGLNTSIDWIPAITLSLFAAVGSLTGSTFSSRLKKENLKSIFVVIIIIAALWMLLKIFV